jgi:hypothetical protein
MGLQLAGQFRRELGWQRGAGGARCPATAQRADRLGGFLAQLVDAVALDQFQRADAQAQSIGQRGGVIAPIHAHGVACKLRGRIVVVQDAIGSKQVQAQPGMLDWRLLMHPPGQVVEHRNGTVRAVHAGRCRPCGRCAFPLPVAGIEDHIDGAMIGQHLQPTLTDAEIPFGTLKPHLDATVVQVGGGLADRHARPPRR